MKKKHLITLTCLLTIFSCSNLFAQQEWPVLKGPYLGQKPPEMTPEAFAPGLLNNEETGSFCAVFSPDGDDYYCCLGYKIKKDMPSGVTRLRNVNGSWSKPEILSINSSFEDNDMCISYDDQRMIFRSWRPLPGDTASRGSYLWVSKKMNNEWSPVKPLLVGGKPIRAGYPSITKKGTLYFSSVQNKKYGIFRSKLINGEYSKPEHVYNVIDSIYSEGDMYIAPDESYMIISCSDHPEMESVEGNFGDLFIAFRKEDGSWNKAINMGKEINTALGENCPQVTPDGKYFFFHRLNLKIRSGNMYWVDAKIIDKLKPDYLK